MQTACFTSVLMGPYTDCHSIRVIRKSAGTGDEMTHFHLEKRGDVHLVMLDNPPYKAVFSELLEAGAQ